MMVLGRDHPQIGVFYVPTHEPTKVPFLSRIIKTYQYRTPTLESFTEKKKKNIIVKLLFFNNHNHYVMVIPGHRIMFF